MDPNEEYLDGLLNSMNSNTPENDNHTMTPEEIEAMFAQVEGLDEILVPEKPSEEVPNSEDVEKTDTLDAIMPEETSEMSQDDIEKLLDQALAETDNQDPQINIEDNNQDLEEINELLKMADNNEAVDQDMLAIMQGIDHFDQKMQAEENKEIEIPNNKVEKTKKEKKSKKEQKEKKKSNFFSKIFAYLTEEDEEPELENKQKELASNSEENETILKELDAEKDKKKKKKKSKKNKNEESLDENDEIVVKKKKEKKPKKEKSVKIEKNIDNSLPEKKLSLKKILIISVIAVTFLVIILLFSIFVTRTLDIKKAKKAFYNEQYVECYQLLYGKNLSDDEQLVLEKSEVILCMERRLTSYENYMRMDKELEALDSLIQAPGIYNNLYEKANSLQILEEITLIYEEILKILNNNYQISEEKAKEISSYESPIKYTEELNNIIEKKNSMADKEETNVEQPIEDLLPREEELEDYSFIE